MQTQRLDFKGLAFVGTKDAVMLLHSTLLGAGRVTIRFDDQAGKVVGGSVTGGTFRPIGLLDAFNGRDMFGDYVLSIADASNEDPLEFFAAGLDADSHDLAGEVPEPGALALLGVGMGGLLWWRRRAMRQVRK